MITIKFNDNIVHTYSSFEEILKLENYNDITYLNYSHTIKSPIYSLIIHILCFTGFKIYSLPKLPNSLIGFEYYDNPIYTHIEKYFNSETKKYFEYKIKLQRIFANKIGNWYLDCKYNPKYLYCRKRLMKEYDELYN